MKKELIDNLVEPNNETPVNNITPGNGNTVQQDDDLFNPERLRLSQNFTAEAGVKKILTSVPVRKPNRQAFVRVHPDPAYRLETAVLELEEENDETYLVEPRLFSHLQGEIVPKILFTAIDRQGTVFLWPIRLPDANGRPNAWNTSHLQAANMAMTKWVRSASNMNLGAYEIFEAPGSLPEPEWPELAFKDLLKIAFQDKFIRSLDHPVVQRLLGKK
jgi:hypothetical protein